MTVWALSLLTIAGVVACGSAVPTRIVGGTEATEGQFSSVVQVDFLDSSSGTWSQRCAASILNQQFILSAAHCYYGSTYAGPSYLQIRAGAIQRNSGGTIVSVSEVTNHPDFGVLSTFDADIAIISLASLLTLSFTIQPSPIIASGSEFPDGTSVVVAGWGHTEEGGSPADVLHFATIATVNREVCRQRYQDTPRQHVVTENMICAGLIDVGGVDACSDDSGGPLFWGDVVIGVISWGDGCGKADLPGVNTRVSSYTNWIIETAV